MSIEAFTYGGCFTADLLGGVTWTADRVAVKGGDVHRTPLDIVMSGFLQVIKVACSVFKYGTNFSFRCKLRFQTKLRGIGNTYLWFMKKIQMVWVSNTFPVCTPQFMNNSKPYSLRHREKRPHYFEAIFFCDSGWEEATSKHNILFALARGKGNVAGILMVDLVSSFLELMRLFHAFPTPFAPEFFNFYPQNKSKITWSKKQGILFQSHHS